MTINNENTNGDDGSFAGASDPSTDAIGGSSGADEGMGGGGGMGGTQSPNTGVSADADSPGSEGRNNTGGTSSATGSSGQTSGGGVDEDDDQTSKRGGSDIDSSTAGSGF